MRINFQSAAARKLWAYFHLFQQNYIINLCHIWQQKNDTAKSSRPYSWTTAMLENKGPAATSSKSNTYIKAYRCTHIQGFEGVFYFFLSGLLSFYYIFDHTQAQRREIQVSGFYSRLRMTFFPFSETVCLPGFFRINQSIVFVPILHSVCFLLDSILRLSPPLRMWLSIDG